MNGVIIMLRHISKVLICLFTVCSLIIAITPIGVAARPSCSTCRMQSSEIKSQYIDEGGNVVIIYEDGVEAIYMTNGEIVLKDYYNVFESDLNQLPTTRVIPGWILIGIGIIGGTLTTCEHIDYVSGHDVCRIILSKLGTSAKPRARYELTGRFIQGYIPGCEPRYSGLCNTGYWEYRVVPL
jgi:hypothetical protein